MTILSIISEYNPFHLGHKYHLEKSLELTQADSCLVLMSGSFVQRGEPAFIDKFRRARACIDNGVDLVLELPFIYASQRAESFAYGAVKLLESLGVVDCISFGAEEDNLQLLSEIAQVLVTKPKTYEKLLNFYIGHNFSFPVARAKALKEYLKNDKIESIINSSNNILAIEYLKAIYRLNSSLKPTIIKRLGEDYNSLEKNKSFMSATGIRHEILNNNIHSIKDYIPISTYNMLEDFYTEYGDFNSLYKYGDILIYLLRNEFFEKNIMDSTPDLIKRLVNFSREFSTLEEIIAASVSKTYTTSRVKRVLVNILLGLSQEKFQELNEIHPKYIRVLAANSNGLEILRQIKKNSNLEIITNFKNHHKLKDRNLEKILYYDKLSTDLFFSSLKNKTYNMDYTISPYIKI